MLRVLLCLWALGPVCDAEVFSAEGSLRVNMEPCPVWFYGKLFSTIFASVENDRFWLSFRGKEEALSFSTISDHFTYEILDLRDHGPDSVLGLDAMPREVTSAECGVRFTSRQAGGVMKTYLLKNGTKTTAHFEGTYGPGQTIEVCGGGFELHRFQVSDGALPMTIDLTGCRNHDGAVVLPQRVVSSNAENCSEDVCSSNGTVQTVSKCSTSQVCVGNNVCFERSYCSIAGSSVLHFHTDRGTVPDFCNYAILHMDSLRVDGAFLKPRLSRVSFLHSVTVTTGSAVIGISQEGRVTLEGVDISFSLSAAPSSYGTADITKDERGVSVRHAHSNNIRTTLIYNGAFLIITQDVPPGLMVHGGGLCGNATPANQEEVPSKPRCPADAALSLMTPEDAATPRFKLYFTEPSPDRAYYTYSHLTINMCTSIYENCSDGEPPTEKKETKKPCTRD